METKKSIEILESFGLTKTQSEIFLFLYTIGKAPASVVGKAIGLERTNTYKALKKLVHKGILGEIENKGIKNFFVADKKIFTHRFEEEEKNISEKRKKLTILQTELKKLGAIGYENMPDIRFFQGKEEINHFYEDIYNNISENNYKVIKMFASNTLDSKSESSTFMKYAGDFISKIKKDGVVIETYLGNGIMTLENIVKTYDIDKIPELPAGNSSLHTYIVGDTTYIAIFKNIAFGLKIESSELTQMLHFLFRNVNYKN